jgi:Poly(R)-hydroxyalkanoic acid synthase subunit (PHA_synth_III_E)
MESPDAWLHEWRTLGTAEWPRGFGAGVPGAASHASGLHDAAAAFTSFAEEFGRLVRAAAADPAAAERLHGELEALAQNFYARAVPAWPSWPGQGAEWAAALQTWSLVLAEIARATATGFAARLAAPEPPATLRATFDAWIDCAESAFQSAAHSERFGAAQARLFNELVRVKARQQTAIEQVAKSAGVPTRSEVDALHDELRALKAELAAARTAPPPVAPSPPRRRAPRKAPR